MAVAVLLALGVAVPASAQPVGTSMIREAVMLAQQPERLAEQADRRSKRADTGMATSP
jgi:hypothetical protein